MKNINRILIAVVSVIVVVGAVFLLSSNANKNSSNNQTTSNMQTQPTATAPPTAAMQEKTATSTAVNLTASGFNPQTITVKVGTKITWTNQSGQIGNVNSVPHPTHTAYPALNLGNFANGQSVSLVFDKVGSYGYHNHLDAAQTGAVVVEQ